VHDRIEHLVHGVEKLIGGELQRSQRVSDRDPFGYDRVSLTVYELSDVDDGIPASICARMDVKECG
jgi:hypothetical protein